MKHILMSKVRTLSLIANWLLILIMCTYWIRVQKLKFTCKHKFYNTRKTLAIIIRYLECVFLIPHSNFLSNMSTIKLLKLWCKQAISMFINHTILMSLRLTEISIVHSNCVLDKTGSSGIKILPYPLLVNFSRLNT